LKAAEFISFSAAIAIAILTIWLTFGEKINASGALLVVKIETMPMSEFS
jgi:hypothetical protein